MYKGSAWAAVVIGSLTATLPTIVLFQAVTYLFVVPLLLGLMCIILGVIALSTGGRYGKHIGKIAVILMLIGTVFPFGMIVYYNRSGYPIVLVVPEQYRGPVRLIIDRDQGVEVPLLDGKYTYQIPETGTLVIKDDSPFRQWHSLTAMYSGGKLIPADHEENLPGEIVSIHSLGSGARVQGGKQEEFIEYFVGTKAEWR